jgi:Ca-activated chloride channel family protein
MLYDWYQHIEFKNAWVLPFLLMLPVLAWLRFKLSRSLKSGLTVTNVHAFRVRTGRNAWLHFPFWLQLLAIGCLILAIARPQLKDVQSRKTGEGIDIVLCMDVSGSMLSQDFQPNRLSVAKDMAIDFVKARPIDQIGLVIFSGESFTQYPITGDHEGLLLQIMSLRSGMLEDGTLIGEGLATSVQRLSTSKAKSKVVILLTDGKEEAPETRLIDPYTALNIAKSKGVKVYVIGMAGSDAVMVREGGRVTRSIPLLDEPLLQRIATETRGKYFRARNTGALRDIYEQIDRLEKSNIEITTKTRYDDQFHYLLLAALFLLALSLVLRYSLLRTFP